MTILSFPSMPAPNAMQFGLRANTQSGGRSPFDGTEQTLALPGAAWVAELTWRNLQPSDWRRLGAFLSQLQGRAGRFYLSPSFAFPRRGTAPFTTLRVNGGGQTGATIALDGWTGAGSAFLMGDFFSYPDSASRPVLHRVTADAIVDTGAATVAITPPIRRSPPDNAVVDAVTASPVWRLSEDLVMEEYEPGERGFAVTVRVEEAIW